MTPYSQDLLKRILDTVQGGDGTLRQIARRFLVSCTAGPARWNPGPMAVATRPYSGRRIWSNSGS